MSEKMLVSYIREEPTAVYEPHGTALVPAGPGFEEREVRTYVLSQRPGQPYGCVVALQNEAGEIHYGWSLCNPNDTFSKKKAREIAVGRARSQRYGIQAVPYRGRLVDTWVGGPSFEPKPVPDIVAWALDALAERAEAFFNRQPTTQPQGVLV